MADPSRASVIGVAAHITAAAQGGPRFDADLSACERRGAENGIWLCAVCAKKVDDDSAFYSPTILRFWKLDAEELADREKGRPQDSLGVLRFAAIALDPGCLWRPSHRLGKVATRIGAMPQIGFHAIPAHAWAKLEAPPSTRSLDPAFDLTLVNDATRTSVLSSVGFEVHAVWSELKGLSHTQKIGVIDGYVLRVEPIALGIPQMIQLPDPIAVPASHPVRIRLTLADFQRNLCGNESLVRFRVAADGVVQRSRLINLGVY